MALRIGKKKDNAGDDWSDSALADNAAAPPAGDPADSFAITDVAPRKGPSPVVLAAGLVLLLTAVGIAAYFFFFNTPVEEDVAPVTPPAEVVPDSPPTTAPKPPTVPVKTSPKAPVKKVPAGKAGIPVAGTKAPAVRPQAGKAPALAPKPNQPTPVPIMPDGVAGQAGKGLQPGNTVLAVQPLSPLTPALQAQLRVLWQQGANAKWRGDYAGARRAWTKMLQLRPRHPGVQEAINKLPK